MIHRKSWNGESWSIWRWHRKGSWVSVGFEMKQDLWLYSKRNVLRTVSKNSRMTSLAILSNLRAAYIVCFCIPQEHFNNKFIYFYISIFLHLIFFIYNSLICLINHHGLQCLKNICGIWKAIACTNSQTSHFFVLSVSKWQKSTGN